MSWHIYGWLGSEMRDGRVAIWGQAVLMPEMWTLGAASSTEGEPQNHNFYVSRSHRRCCAKPTPVYYNSPWDFFAKGRNSLSLMWKCIVVWLLWSQCIFFTWWGWPVGVGTKSKSLRLFQPQFSLRFQVTQFRVLVDCVNKVIRRLALIKPGLIRKHSHQKACLCYKWPCMTSTGNRPLYATVQVTDLNCFALFKEDYAKTNARVFEEILQRQRLIIWVWIFSIISWGTFWTNREKI